MNNIDNTKNNNNDDYNNNRVIMIMIVIIKIILVVTIIVILINFQANILENGADPKCRVCNKHTETIDHLVSGCPILAPTEYLNRHDRLGQYIHWCLCKNFCLPHERNWWEHKPPKVIENKNATILWDFDIHTDRTIQANRPDIAVKNHNDKTCFLIDMPVPSDTNVSLKIFEKLT